VNEFLTVGVQRLKGGGLDVIGIVQKAQPIPGLKGFLKCGLDLGREVFFGISAAGLFNIDADGSAATKDLLR